MILMAEILTLLVTLGLWVMLVMEAMQVSVTIFSSLFTLMP